MTLYGEAFLNLLDRFAKWVKQGKYDKLEYNLWRDLYGLAKSDGGVEADIKENYFNDIDLDIYPDYRYDKSRHYEFSPYDYSFGEFLAEELRESNLMQVNINTCHFGEPTANKSVLENNALDVDSIKIGYKDSPNLYTLASKNSVAYGSDIEWDTVPRMSDLAITRERVEELGKMVVDHVNREIIFEERKEKKKMNGFNFEFGSCEHDNVRMSMYGLAVKNATGTWVSYDLATKAIVDVDILNFEGGKYMYKMPVAIKDIAPGDIIIHARKPLFVTEIASGKLIAIDPFAGEEKIVLPTRSPFGFDFATKIVCLFDGMIGGASAAAPFGNMLPLLMLGDGKDMDPAMLMFAMGGKMDMSNPMMMYMLMKDGGNSDLLPLMMMMNCGCHCHCDCDCEQEG